MPTLTRRELLKLLAVAPLVTLRGPVASAPAGQRPDGRPPPNILILVFDTFSASHSPLYGYQRETTPNLQRFADRAVSFHAHYSPGSYTTPGTASFLTGVYPWSHRAVNIQSTVLDEFAERNLFRLVGEAGYHSLAYSHNIVVSTLLDQFRSAIDEFVRTAELSLQDRYQAQWLFPSDFTPAVHAESLITHRGDTASSLFLYEAYRFWTTYVEQRLNEERGERFPRGLPSLQGQVFLLEHAIDWTMEQLDRLPQPFLAYLHFLPPHDPYHARSDFIGRFDDGRTPPPKPTHALTQGWSDQFLLDKRLEYDEYLAYTDAELGRLLAFMEQRGFLDTTIVVVTSDHGELFERGIWGHITPVLYDPLVRIPLVVSVPGQREGGDVHVPTSAVDVLPTLLHAAGIRTPEWVEGRRLPGILGGEADVERPVYCMDAKESSRFGPLHRRTVGVVKGRFSLTHYQGYREYDDRYEMYDLREDPHELSNIDSSRNGMSQDLRELLNRQRDKLNRQM